MISPQDELGNRVPDFSTAGFRNSNEPLPDSVDLVEASRIVTVSPIDGDNTAHIQAAIDQVEAFARNSSGFRGIVQFTAGEFPISGFLTVLANGVVLRGTGHGDEPAVDTILRATGSDDRSLIQVGANNSSREIRGTRHNIVDKYVPVGATSVTVDSTASWNVGNQITLFRPSTAEWLTELGMDQIPPRSDGGAVVQWEPGFRYDQSYERVLTRIEGNRVFFDAPIMHSFDQQFGGGYVFRHTFNRIRNIGIENLRGKSDFTSPIDEEHARTFIDLRAVEDAWVRDVTGQHFIYATVLASTRSKRVTVENAASLDPISRVAGGRRYPFTIDGQFILMRNLFSENARHDFINNSAARGNRGPNVFLDGVAVNSQSTTGPHQRYSTGTLYDTIQVSHDIEARNRGNFGTGHGWAGANYVFWNTIADEYIVQSPPTAQNWLIGAQGRRIVNETRFGRQPAALIDSFRTPIDFQDANNPTNSLFVAQLNQRLSLHTHDHRLQQRQYLLGDYDRGEYDGRNSADHVFADPTWLDELKEFVGTSTLSPGDVGATNQYVPFSFSFALEADEAVYSAVLTLGLRGTSGNTNDDVLLFESSDDSRLLSVLTGKSLERDKTTPVTIELVEHDLAALQDGSLNLAITNDAVLDFASLELGVGPSQPKLTADIDGDLLVSFADFLILSFNFGRSDATRDEGDIDGDRVVTFADFLILSQDFGKGLSPTR